MIIDGIDLTAPEYGLVLSQVAGLHDIPVVEHTAPTRTGRAGALPVARAVGTRGLVVRAVLVAPTHADALVQIGRVKAVLGRAGPRTIRVPDIATRMLRAEVQRVMVTAQAPAGQGRARVWLVDVEAVAYDPPWWLDVTTQVISGIAATAVAVPQGDARPDGMVIIITDAVDPVLVWGSGSGQDIAAMAFAGTLAAGESWVIDIDRETVYRNSTGAPNEGVYAWSEFTGSFIRPDPAHWDVVAGTAPTLRVSTGQAEVRYRRAYQ